MKRPHWYLFVFLIGFLFCYFPLQTQAAGAGYGVSPLLPENQLDDATYFNLLVTPDNTQELHLQLSNQEDQAKTLKITPATASTSNTGTIQYTTTKAELLNGPVLSELLSPPQTITLQGKETKIVTFTLTLPKQPFQGILLGSFFIEEVNQDTSSPGLNNQFAYEIGLMIRESKKLPAPKLSFNNLQLKNNDLSIQLANQKGRLSVGTLKATLVGKEQAFSKELQLAPNTDAQIGLPFEELPTGASTLKLTFTTDNGKRFEYQQAIYLHNRGDEMKLTKLPIPWQWIVVGGIFVALLILTTVIFIIKKTRKS